MSQYSEELVQYAMKVLRQTRPVDDTEFEDIAQELRVRAWKSQSKAEQPLGAGWYITVASNLWNDNASRVKKSRHVGRIDDHIEIPHYDEHKVEDDSDKGIMEAIQTLPLIYQEVLKLHAADVSYEAGAKLLGIELRTYRSRLFNARRKLDKVLGLGNYSNFSTSL